MSDDTILTDEQRERLIYLVDLLNDPSVTQLDTDEQREYEALLAELSS